MSTKDPIFFKKKLWALIEAMANRTRSNCTLHRHFKRDLLRFNSLSHCYIMAQILTKITKKRTLNSVKFNLNKRQNKQFHFQDLGIS